MQMRFSTKRLLTLFLFRLGVCAAIGVFFGGTTGAVGVEPALLGAAFGALAGAIYATAAMAFIGGTEMFLPRTRVGRALDRAPFLATFVVKLVTYSAVLLVIAGGRIGVRIATIFAGFTIGEDFALAFEQQIKATLPTGQLVSVTVLAILLILLLFQMSQLVGERTFRAIALGRYHHSQAEERFFLFIDIVGSTPLGERLGPRMAHEFLARVFQLASDPIDDHAGEVHQYVGDEMIITWTVPEGRANARPLACLFAIEDALNFAGPDFERRFSAVPRLRAALHAGPVVTGEVGGSRRAIVFHGDVMNTASRIENATRELQRPFLVSEDALIRLDDKDVYSFVDLGMQQFRGREAPVRVYAVARRERFS